MSGNTAKSRVSDADVSVPDKILTSRQSSPEADTKTQYERPKGISLAQTEEQLVENIFSFAKDARDKGRKFYSRANIACYFQGDINWFAFSEGDKKKEILAELPDI